MKRGVELEARKAKKSADKVDRGIMASKMPNTEATGDGTSRGMRAYRILGLRGHGRILVRVEEWWDENGRWNEVWYLAETDG